MAWIGAGRSLQSPAIWPVLLHKKHLRCALSTFGCRHSCARLLLGERPSGTDWCGGDGDGVAAPDGTKEKLCTFWGPLAMADAGTYGGPKDTRKRPSK